MRILALDVGLRKTGAAYGDSANGIPIALDTFMHETIEAFADHVTRIVRDKKIDRIVLGLPLLPSGDEGSQSDYVRSCGVALARLNLPVDYLDERYTTHKSTEYDGDAAAACDLLSVALKKAV